MSSSDRQDNPGPKKESHGPARVLFLCTHNSARSQMAEAILRHLGADKVLAYSAGSRPGRVHPDALRTLDGLGVPTYGLSSKHISEFRGQEFDYVVTVCDRARETCPAFPGKPAQVHWSYPDPSGIEDEAERLATFRSIAGDLMERNTRLLAKITGEQQSSRPNK